MTDQTARREILAAEYVRKIGYNPFEDDPTITADEVQQTLEEYDAEVKQTATRKVLGADIYDRLRAEFGPATQLWNTGGGTMVAVWEFEGGVYTVSDEYIALYETADDFWEQKQQVDGEWLYEDGDLERFLKRQS